MVKYYCDKCGAQVPCMEPTFRFGRPLFRVTHVDAKEVEGDYYSQKELHVEERSILLCPECQEKLYQFIFSKTYEDADRERWERQNKVNTKIPRPLPLG